MLLTRLIATLLGLWAGSLVTVCAIAAPTAFAVLTDRHAAGQIASRLFLIETLIGIFVSVVFFLAYATDRLAATRVTALMIAIAAAAPLISQVVLTPLMDAARTSGDMARFGALHGVSALLFLVACVGSLTAFWLFNRPAA